MRAITLCLAASVALGASCIGDPTEILFGQTLAELCAEHEDPLTEEPLDPTLTAKEIGDLWAPKTPPPAGCALADETVWSDVLTLHTVTRSAQRDIAAYGNAASQLARGLIAGLVLEQIGLDDPNEGALEDLVDFGRFAGMTARFEFDAAAGGSWVLGRRPTQALAEDTGMTVWFRGETSPQAIEADPFALSSYLVGVQATSTERLDDMLRDWSLRSTFTWTWQARGPLAHLLASGKAIPQTFSLTLSLSDLVDPASYASGATVFGPFGSLTRLALDAKVAVDEVRNGVSVAYAVEARGATLGELASGAALPLTLSQAEASFAGLRMETTAEDLRYLGQLELAGALTHAVRAEGVGLDAMSDYGEGAVEPTEFWSCAAPLESMTP